MNCVIITTVHFLCFKHRQMAIGAVVYALRTHNPLAPVSIPVTFQSMPIQGGEDFRQERGRVIWP
jgi:hypothetical protein